MKTAKLVIGIISIALFFLVGLQSCAAGLSNTLADTGEISGTAGVMVAFVFLVAGIVAVAARRSKGASIFCAVFYLLAFLIGISNYGSYADLQIWSYLCSIFGVLFVIFAVRTKKE